MEGGLRNSRLLTITLNQPREILLLFLQPSALRLRPTVKSTRNCQ